MTANNKQVGGSHYQLKDKQQHWDLVQALGWDYFRGQLSRYIVRYHLKNGKEDLLKAKHYAEKMLEIYDVSKSWYLRTNEQVQILTKFVEDHGLNKSQQTILHALGGLVENCYGTAISKCLDKIVATIDYILKEEYNV